MNIIKDLMTITDKSIDYITKLIKDSDIGDTAEHIEEIYAALGAVAVLITDFARKNLENKKELN